MKSHASVVLLFVCACSSGKQGDPGTQGATGSQGPVGPTGLTGATGPAGIQGPAGVQGPAGPATVSVRAVDAGSACPAGGAVLTDSDGGQVTICSGQNGAQGIQGTQGAFGAQGATGAPGLQGIAGASSVALFSADGGRVGNIDVAGQMVFVEALGCFAQVDAADNVVVGYGALGNGSISGQVFWTGTNCTGTPVAPARGITYSLPLYCWAYGNKTYRAVQPFVPQMITVQSLGGVQAPLDGGAAIYSSCSAVTSYQTQMAFAMEEVVMPAFIGPFTVGVR